MLHLGNVDRFLFLVGKDQQEIKIYKFWSRIAERNIKIVQIIVSYCNELYTGVKWSLVHLNIEFINWI